MQKIPTIFEREQQGKRFLAVDQINPDAAWVFEGEGTATIKWDGSACLIKDGQFYRRLALKQGRLKPEGWIHWNFNNPSPTGHGWTPVIESPENQYHLEAWENDSWCQPDGTYELVGPKVQRNPYKLNTHQFRRHGVPVVDLERNFEMIHQWLEDNYHEGLVWHHPDGRMAKIKRRDFGIRWP